MTDANTLTDVEVTEVCAKLQKIGLANRRDGLLNGVRTELTDKLKDEDTKTDLLLSDLRLLNADAEGSNSIRTWLENAADHAVTHPDVRRFLNGLADKLARSENGAMKSGASGLEAAGSDTLSTGDERSFHGLSPELEALGFGTDTFNERAIFTNDLLPIGFLSRASVIGMSICRLKITRHEGGVPHVSLTGRKKRYFGTGWLIGSSYIITNHHVVNGRDPGEPTAPQSDLEPQAKSAKVEFDYDEEDVVTEDAVVSELAHSNKELDYAILKLSEETGRSPLRLWSREVSLSDDEVAPVNIIQHPGGAPKQIGMRNNLIARITDRDLAYFTDTKGGSSGSPVCNDAWQVVALHKAATRTFGAIEFQGKETQWVNIGTRIDRIINDLVLNQPDLWGEINPSI